MKARYRLATFRHPVRRNLKRKSWTSALKSIAKHQSSRNPFNSLKILKSEDRSKDCDMNKMGIAHVLLLRGVQVEINYYVR